MNITLRSRLSVPLLLSLLLVACQHTPRTAHDTAPVLSPSAKTTTTAPQAWLAPGVQVNLPPPGITPSLHQQQLLSGDINGKPQSLLVLLNADQHNITLAGLSSLGIRLFLLTYDADGIHSEHSLLLPQLPPPGQVLADVMLSHWPISVWQPQLPAGWTLRDIGQRRELRDNQHKLISEVDYQQQDGRREPVAITQHAFHYHLRLQALEH